jgi:biopolymer transport protein ExbD
MKLKTTYGVEAGKFSMAAMSDLAFLLIIFFMVCAQFVQQSGTEVELPLAGTGTESDELPIKVTITKNGAIFVNDLSIPTAELPRELQGRIRMAETPTDRTVILRAERTLDYGTIRPVVDAVDRSGGMLELAVVED